MARAAIARARSNDLIRERLEERRLLLRRQVEAMFAPELEAAGSEAGREVAAAIDVMLELDALEHLRRHRRLSGTETKRVVVRSVTAMLHAIS